MNALILASVGGSMALIAWQDWQALGPGSTLAEWVNVLVEWSFVVFIAVAVSFKLAAL